MKTLYLIFLSFFLSITMYAQVSEEEFQALKALYNSTGGNNWKNKTGWENINTTATKNNVTSNWYGLKVSNGHVDEISLGANNLVGNIPAQISGLKWLKSLDMYNNKLEGTFPSAIGELTSLIGITISSNLLTGPLPESLGNLKKLETIYLSENPLNCDFPNEILKQMVALRRFDAGNCGFTGNISDIFNSIPKLVALILTNNKITGSLPPSINKLKLDQLHLGNNKFSGPLPSLDSSQTTMYYLTFWVNQFTGSIPYSYGTFTKLKYFHIEDNKISGNIPAGMFTPFLQRMNIHQNYFTFAGIEPVYNNLKNLYQKEFYQNKMYPVNMTEISVNEGASLSLNATALSQYELGGNNNRYKWFLNDVEVYSGNNPAYTVPIATAAHSGIYRFEVTNTVVTELKLKSDPITVSVLVPGNNPPTNITINVNSINENFSGDFGTLKATDADTSDTHTFTLAKGNGTNDRDNGMFSITGKMLKLNSFADYESTQQLNLFVMANDFKGGLFTKALTINVNNVNEAPEFKNQVTSATIDETAPNGFVILYLQAKDPENKPVIYSISSGNDDNAFGIDGNKLIVKDNTKLNYDVKNQYILKVNASDSTNSANIDIKVTLSKINKMPIVENSGFSVLENSNTGTFIGTVTATDPEGSPLTYTLTGGNDFDGFILENNEIYINNKAAIDFDVTPTFFLTVNVSDGISNVQAIITVNLLNELDETGNDILNFSFSGMKEAPVIDYTNNTITALITGKDITQIYPDFRISKGATSNPKSGTMFNFLSPQAITVTSEMGTSKIWTVSVSYPVSLQDQDQAKLNIYPNPVHDILFIEGIDKNCRAYVLSTDGKLIMSKILTNSENSINISALSQGLYLILLETSNGIKTSLRLVKE
ncbi:MAG: cadherin domain-containing protein [Saprospiraceae bacterium]|nr:cadherin domain-containing protein [Saprospiraceae bacterium]